MWLLVDHPQCCLARRLRRRGRYCFIDGANCRCPCRPMHSKPSPCGLRALLVLYAAHFIGGPLVVVVVPQEAHREFSRTSDVYACCSAGTTRPYLGLPLRFRARRGRWHPAYRRAWLPIGTFGWRRGYVDTPRGCNSGHAAFGCSSLLGAPHPASVYNACLPLLLLILSLLPFLAVALEVWWASS